MFGLFKKKPAVDESYHRENSLHRLTQAFLVRRQNKWEIFNDAKLEFSHV